MKTRPLVCLCGALISLGLPGGALSAQQAGLQLGIALSDSLLSSGETLTARVQVANPGGSGGADFYFAILLPDGSTIVSAGPGVGARFGRFADLRTLVPVAGCAGSAAFGRMRACGAMASLTLGWPATPDDGAPRERPSAGGGLPRSGHSTRWSSPKPPSPAAIHEVALGEATVPAAVREAA